MERPHMHDDRDQQESLLGRPARANRSKSLLDYLRINPRKKLCGLGLAALIAGLVVLGLVINLSHGEKKSSERPCNTPECVIAAAKVLSNMNRTADPCQDFYEYSCGGWIAEHPIPDDKSQIGTFNDVQERNIRILKNVLESAYQDSLSLTDQDYDRENFNRAQGLYSSCLNETQIDSFGAEPLIRVLKQVTEQFPLGKASKLDADKTAVAIANAHGFDVAALFNLFVAQDDKEPQVNVINLGQGGLSLPSKEYYEDSSFIDTLRDVVEKSFTALLPAVKADENEVGHEPKIHEDWAVRAAAVVDFEMKLAGIFLPNSELMDPSALYNAYTPPSLKRASPFFPWDVYLRALFPSQDFDGIIGDETKLIVQVPTFFGNLSSVLLETKPEAFEDYLIWQHIYAYIDHTATSVRSVIDPLKEKTGQKAKVELPRWRTCLSRTDRLLGELIGRYFVEKAFGGDSKKAASEAVEYIKRAFVERLPNIEWLDKPTRQRAIVKVNALITKIGFADILFEPKTLYHKYESVHIEATKYLDNILVLAHWHIIDNLKQILKPVDRTKWEMTPPTVNAYYNPGLNEIVFPAGILQPPFYHFSFPSYLAQGAIGAVVGHELTHAFDNNGRQYDHEGRLKDWWTDKTKREFERKAQCFIDQYAQYAVIGSDGVSHHVDGKLTLGENLADNGGLARTYEAWKMDLESPDGKKRNFMLPGFDGYSKAQLFYLAFAQVWCSNTRAELALRRIRTDPHSPNKYRVIGALVNSEEFAQAYKCPVGSPMNPNEKCLIW